jgi:hypothetical protein
VPEGRASGFERLDRGSGSLREEFWSVGRDTGVGWWVGSVSLSSANIDASEEFPYLNIMNSVALSVSYLESREAFTSIERNPYWPKWNSPWWHMVTLEEMGLSDRIPRATAERLLVEIERTHLPYFFRDQAPPGKPPHQDAPCPCSFGNIYRVLSATNVDVDRALPWARKWFVDHQMPDGGLNCDEDAYRADAGASSLVGTIAPLEAILLTRREYSPEEERFLDRGAQCLLERELRLGSRSRHNAEECEDEEDWLKLCFPRFYFYDVLRGLAFILEWAERRNQPIPRESISKVVEHLESSFPDGNVRSGRRIDVVSSFNPEGYDSKSWKRVPESRFPLFEEASAVEQVSSYLTKQWANARRNLSELEAKGLLLV